MTERARVLGLLVVSCFAATACDNCSEAPADPSDSGPGVCVLDGDCDSGEVCREGACVETVGTDGGVEEDAGVVDAGPAGEGVLTILPETAVEFGATRLGIAIERNVTLKNTGTAALRILQIIVDNDPAGVFSAEPVGTQDLELLPDAEVGMALTYLPNDGTPDSAEIDIVHTGAGQLTTITLFAEFKGDPLLSVTSDPAVLEPNVTEVNFGDVPAGGSAAVNLYVRNNGAADSVLDALGAQVTPGNAGFGVVVNTGTGVFLPAWNATCASDVAQCADSAATCTNGVCLDAAGAPLDAVPMTITFAPTSDATATATLSVRTAIAGEPQPAFDVTLRGRGVTGQLVVTPGALDLGTAFVNRPVRRTLEVRNAGAGGLSIVSIANVFPGGAFTVPTPPALPRGMGAGDTFNLDVDFGAPAAGQFNQILRFTDSDGEETDVVLTGAARLAPVVRVLERPALTEVQPTGVPFGDVFVNTTSQRTLRIENNGPSGSVMRVLRMAIDGAAAGRYALAPSTIDTDLNATVGADVVVTYLPTAITPGGNDEAELVIETDDPDRPAVVVPLSGRAIQPRIIVSDSSIDFGPILVGTSPSPTRVVTVRNDGFGPLVISSVTGSGAPFSIVPSTSIPAALQPLQTLTLTVTFTPTAAAAVAGNLTILSSDVTQPTSVVGLIGSGGACLPRANATVSVVGNQCIYSCLGGFHACGDSCLANNSPDSCGTSCTPCRLRGGTERGCTVATSTCTYACSEDFFDLNGDRNEPQSNTTADGCEYECPVANPTGEVCNQLDDNCNGVADDGLATDSFDQPANSNDTCGVADSRGNVREGQTQTTTASLYPFPAVSGSDEDWYVITGEEDSNVCVPFSDEDFRTRFQLEVPPGVDYDIEVYNGCSQLLVAGRLGLGADEDISFTYDGSCTGDDDRTYRVRIIRFGNSGTCDNYVLRVSHSQL